MGIPENLYQEDIESFVDILDRFKRLQDTEYSTAYKLHKDALAEYDRWSTILFETRRNEMGSKKDPPWKTRIDDILRILNNIYVSSRMVYGRAKDDYDTKIR